METFRIALRVGKYNEEKSLGKLALDMPLSKESEKELISFVKEKSKLKDTGNKTWYVTLYDENDYDVWTYMYSDEVCAWCNGEQIDHLHAQEILSKPFIINTEYKGEIELTRMDYEEMPSAMVAFNWSDEDMQLLAKTIEWELNSNEYCDDDDFNDTFWKVMEEFATHEGMTYYEDYLGI